MAIWLQRSSIISRKTALPPPHPPGRGLQEAAGNCRGRRCFIPEMRWLKFKFTHDTADCSLSGWQSLGKKGTA